LKLNLLKNREIIILTEIYVKMYDLQVIYMKCVLII